MWRWITAGFLVCAAAGTLWLFRGREPPEERYKRSWKFLRDGDFERAAAEARKAASAAPTPEWRSRFRLLEAEALLDSGKAEPAMALLEGMESGATVEQHVRSRALRARRLVGKAGFSAAVQLLEEARSVATEHDRPDLLAEIDLLLGQIEGRQRRLKEAESWFHRAREEASRAGDQFRLGAAANNLGMIRMIGARCDEAISYFQEAVSLYEAAEANHWVAAARNNIGVCYSQLGDIENAFTYREAALGLSRPSLLKANALGETGTVLLTEDAAKAIPYYRKACDMAREFGALTDAARWAGNLASALAEKGQWDEAEAALSEARQLGPEPRSRAFLELNAAAIALGRGRPDEARRIYQEAAASSPDNPAVLWQAHAGIASAWMAEGRGEEAARSFEAAIRVVEDTQSGLNRNELKLTFLARLIRLYQSYVDLLISRNEPIRALAVADRSRARLLSEHLARQVGRAGPEMSASNFRAVARESDSVWLSYWLAPKRSFLWVVTPSDVRVFTLPGENEIAELVREYRAFVETGIRDPLLTPSSAGGELYKTLIGPASELVRSGRNVIVVPDGVLYQLSFDTLPVYDSTEPHYVADDAAIAVTPSFGVFHRRPRPVHAEDALIVGDPLSPAPEFPRLEHAGKEIAGVAKRIGAAKTTVIAGEQAKPEIWKTVDPGRFSLIHIAAHAEANPRSPLDSAIILSPGSQFRLYARDIIEVPLSADLVSLSACRSSGARTYAGEGIVGFAWAFLHAGARSVIAGLWDVPDESTPMLMETLYTGLAAGETPVQALRHARLALRRSAYAKPFYWGAFQLYLR